MNENRWREIDRIYHEAHSRPVGQRAAFLAGACVGDISILREVELMLAQAASKRMTFSRITAR